MKRIVVWIDSKDDDVKRVRRRLEKLLSSLGLWYNIVDVCELVLEDSK